MTHDDIATMAQAHGFSLVAEERLNEIDGTAYVMRHEASKARLLYLRNDDANKAFSISFKTPAADDTGVFHILEHSVLCGSRKFPVKEPFVNLLKTSMQTFLNAMTFPDKTMYPVASTNDRDLMNLMDVYLDAVFYPDIYRKRTIFEQEGWHYELTGALADDAQEPPITFNGVVYNEMKGALSDPDSVLCDELAAALFPDTTYRFESGGDPRAIPDLTYEGFLDAHRRHYRPDNSYLMLYGNMDVEPYLAFLDEEYLTPLASRFAGVPLDENPLDVQTAVKGVRTTRTMATTAENAGVALGVVIGEAAERERIVAVDILLDALMGSNEAPLKRALLDAGLAADAVAFVYDAVRQPFAVVQLKGVRSTEAGAVASCERAADELRRIVEREAARLADGGLDHDLVASALAHAEFVMREHNFGYPDGVIYAMASMSGWLYDDELAVAYLRYEDVFASLRAKLSGDYFERLVRELFLDAHHDAEVLLVPTDADEEAAERERLRAAASAMTPVDLEAIEREVQALRAAQEQPDSPDDLAKLPHLSVADIGEAPSAAPFELDESGPVPLLRHGMPTHGIVYANRYYDLGAVSFEELPAVRILALVLSRLATDVHTAAEIDLIVQGRLGNLTFFTEVHERADGTEGYAAKLVVMGAALDAEAEALQSLVAEILYTTVFDDAERVRDMLQQQKVAFEQAVVNSGHSVAVGRAASYCSRAALVREQLRGIDAYCFVADVLDSYDERAEELLATLRELAVRIFRRAPLLVSFAGDEAAYDTFRTALFAEVREHREVASETGAETLVSSVPEPRDRHEAFVVPSDVSFTALGFDRRLLDDEPPYSGTLLLASRILSFDYLWNEVRVKGGAYGTGFQTTRSGALRFYSYRDPHIDETVGRFADAGHWLEDFRPDHEEMEGYVVSTVASLDAPEKPRDAMRRHDGMFFSGVTEADRERTRAEAIASRPGDVRSLGSVVSAVAREHRLCCVGGRDLIERSAIDFEVKEVFGG